MKYKLISMLIVFAVGCLLLSGCKSSSSEEATGSLSETETTPTVQKLTIAGDRLDGVNPLLNGENDLTGLIFSGLLKYDENGKLQGDLAQTYTYDKETRTWTFLLREGVMWQDGEMLTADDVMYTYTVLTQDETLNSDIRSDYDGIESVESDGMFTVTVKLKEGSNVPVSCFTVGILPKNLLEGDSINTSAFNKNPVGTGMYRVISWTDHEITLEVNDFYYEKKPNIQEIVYTMADSSSEKATLLEQGKADIACLDISEVSLFQNQEDYKSYCYETNEFYALIPDYTGSFWSKNADILPALNQITNKNLIIRDIFNGHASAAYLPLQHSTNKENISYGMEWSNDDFAATMKKSGWALNTDKIYTKGGQICSFTVQVQNNDTYGRKIAALLQKQYAQSGIRMQIKTVDQIVMDGSTDGALSTFCISGSETVQNRYYSTNGSGNSMHYSNKQIDTLLEQAASESNEEKQSAYYQQFAKKYIELGIQIPIVYPKRYYIARSNISGIKTNLVLGKNASGILNNIKDWEILPSDDNTEQ